MQDDLDPPTPLPPEKPVSVDSDSAEIWGAEPPVSREISDLPKPLGIGAGCGFALLLIFISAWVSGGFNTPSPFFLGAFVAIAFAFSRQTRSIFIAYISIVAFVCLAFAIICGPMFHGL